MRADTMSLFKEAWRQMTETMPSPDNATCGPIVKRLSDTNNLFFNLWLQDSPTIDEQSFRAMLKAGKVCGKQWAHPTGGIFCTDWAPANWQEILDQEGLSIAINMVGMETASIVPSQYLPADIEIRQATDDLTAMDAAMVNAHAYHMPEDEFTCAGGMFFWPENSIAFVGYIDGRPVCSAAARNVNDTVYIALVATEPDQQGKGYADTVMRHAIDEGRKLFGHELLTLHATMDGQPTYEKMGFVAGPTTPLVVTAG